MKSPDISQVAKASGVPASSLRYYEERGLISPIGRRGLRRIFSASIYDRLALIALGQAAGFSLDEVAEMLGDDGQPDIDRATLVAKADEIDRRIQHLSALRDGLLHASACPQPRLVECPTFHRLLSVAAKATRRRSIRSKEKRASLAPPIGTPLERGHLIASKE